MIFATILSRFSWALALSMLSLSASAQWAAPDVQEPSSPEDIQRALSGGVPSGRWKVENNKTLEGQAKEE